MPAQKLRGQKLPVKDLLKWLLMYNAHAASRLGKQLSGFGLAGGLATGLHWGLMTFLISNHLAPILATALGSLLGATTNFVLQHHLAFPLRQLRPRTYQCYILVCLLAWCANLFFFYLCRGIGLALLSAQLLATALVTIQNFFLYKYVVFNEHSHKSNVITE